MPRRKALDDDKRSTICSLVTAGVSLRQAANYVGCSPKSIRRDINRNGQFRANLAKARSEARMHPLDTLRQAAKTNWRAALALMERLAPDRFADPNESIVTKREANLFVDELIASIEETVSDPDERGDLFDLLEAAMPTAMRRRWDGEARDRAVDRVRQNIEERERDREISEEKESHDRDFRRRALFRELSKHVPYSLHEKLNEYVDLSEPEEVFAGRPKAADAEDVEDDDADDDAPDSV
jgi:hypothetical protein